MNIRRGINYLLLLSNWVIAIGIVVVLGIYLFNKDQNNLNTFYHSMNLAIISPVVAEVVSSLLLGLYAYLLNKFLKKDNKLNPKLFSLIKTSSLIALFNLLIPFILVITALSINYLDKLTILILICVALSISILIGLFISGYTSYINLRISYSEEKRKTLLNNMEPELKMYKDDTKYKDDNTKQKYEKTNDQDKDKLATSGTFGNE